MIKSIARFAAKFAILDTSWISSPGTCIRKRVRFRAEFILALKSGSWIGSCACIAFSVAAVGSVADAKGEREPSQTRFAETTMKYPDGKLDEKSGLWFSPEGRIYTPDQLAKVGVDGRRYTSGGVPFERLITLKVGDNLFRVPAGFLVPWPLGDYAGETITGWDRRGGMSIHLWIPSGRPFEIRTFPEPGFPQPREYLRPPAPSGEFPVYVLYLRIGSVPGYTTPEQGVMNQVEVLKLSGFVDPIVDMEERHGLQWYKLARDAGISDSYRSAPDTEPQILLHCHSTNSNLPYPGCSGRVYFPKDELSFYFRFPRLALPLWKTATTMIRNLALSWVVSGK